MRQMEDDRSVGEGKSGVGTVFEEIQAGTDGSGEGDCQKKNEFKPAFRRRIGDGCRVRKCIGSCGGEFGH